MIEYIRRQVVLGCITEVVQPESVRQKAAYFMVPAVFLIIPQLEVILPGIARSTFFQILVLILSHDFPLDEIHPESYDRHTASSSRGFGLECCHGNKVKLGK